MIFSRHAKPQQIYEQLIEPIAWETGSRGASFVEKSISDKADSSWPSDMVSTPSDANKVVDSLLAEALRVATQKENREAYPSALSRNF